jgi:hypothetical protein
MSDTTSRAAGTARARRIHEDFIGVLLLMENAILTWVAVPEYIPNTLCANAQAQEFIQISW